MTLSINSVALCPNAEARDLTGRLGIGYVDQFADYSPFFDLPALSAKYAITKDIAVLGCFGINTRDPAAYTFCLKVMKNIFYEINLNFYAGGAFGVLMRDSKTGIGFQGLFGTEIFIPGIESLGLSFEAGVSASNITGSFAIRTLGLSFLHAGVHFYF